MKLFFFYYSILLTVVSCVGKNLSTNDKCSHFLISAGASSNFAGSVAHAIHSMTVKDLKQFYSTATVNNFVPTVNKNLTADNAILLNAPDNDDEPSLYFTEAMNTVDSVLTKMDGKLWDIKNYSPLEKLVHAFHMKEVWARALKEFRIIENGPPINDMENVCQCVMDIGNNGIMQIMKYLALVIREPSLVLGNPAFKGFSWNGNAYIIVGYHFTQAGALTGFGNENGEMSMPRLDNAESWKIWKQMVSREESYDAALFLYCAAKKAEKNLVAI